MTGFEEYVRHLEELALLAHGWCPADFRAALNGQCGSELTRAMDIGVRREFGAFFTSSKLARELVKGISITGRCIDPTCGAGDLLLAAASRFPTRATLSDTIDDWGQKLLGFDINRTFVDAAKARLVLLARKQGNFTTPFGRDKLRQSFPGLQIRDSLARPPHLQSGDTVLMNPPYYHVAAPQDCLWAGGKVNAAALFIANIIVDLPNTCQVIAILPEVLRAGTNYRKWRQHTEDKCDIHQVRPVGIFDRNADVDVFILTLANKRGHGTSWLRRRTAGTKLSDHFDVSVGSVVPHRDEEVGAIRRFLDAKTAPSFKVLKRVALRRKYEGKVFQPPFVTIKRTSRPGDRHRAVPTVVLGSKPVAVENHLIVCRPKDNERGTCEWLMRELKQGSITTQLDKLLRCRHLTVSAVRGLRLRSATGS